MRIAKITSIVRPVGLGLVALLALSVASAAQDKPAKPAKPEDKPGATPATPAKPATPASQARSTSADTTTIIVTGLTAENAAAVRTSLEGIQASMWRCPDCTMSQMEKGMCTMCNKELVVEKSASLKNVATDADKGTIAFALVPGHNVHLTAIESAVTGQKLSIPRDKLLIAPNSTLLITGVSSEESVDKLEAELKNSKLFDTVNARIVGTGKPVEVTVKGGTTPATRAKVEEALAKAGPDVKLVDIVWMSPASAAAPAGSTPKSKG